MIERRKHRNIRVITLAQLFITVYFVNSLLCEFITCEFFFFRSAHNLLKFLDFDHTGGSVQGLNLGPFAPQ